MAGCDYRADLAAAVKAKLHVTPALPKSQHPSRAIGRPPKRGQGSRSRSKLLALTLSDSSNRGWL